MALSRTILIAGAGIGGLTAALALAERDFRVVVFDQAERLEETGAGLQLSPNAARVLIGLGLAQPLAAHLVVPQAVSIRLAKDGGELARIPLGPGVEFRYGAPYWVVHRGDLQAALLERIARHPDISLRLATRVQDFAVHAHGVTAELQQGSGQGSAVSDERGIALIGADGLWSTLRQRLRTEDAPRFAHRTAWRATLDAAALPDALRAPLVQLWLGPNAHLVHYPVSGGQRVNIVAIVFDREQHRRWSVPGHRDDLLPHFPAGRWASAARDLLALPQQWLKWSLFERASGGPWGRGAMTLMGDAAHAALPFVAQGAAMAIEDAATLARCLGEAPGAPAEALRLYERLRRARTARVQRAARITGDIYHLSGPLALARNMALRTMGGEKLRERYDWLYDWRV